MALEIEAAVIDSMLEHARREAPLECCGLLMGQARRITGLRVMENVARSPVRYEMSPRELLRFFKDLRGSGLLHLGIYHSHPSSEAYPSPTDIAEAYYPDCAYVILSLEGSESPAIRAFTIIDGLVEEQAIERC